MENLVDSKNLTLSVITPVYNSELILPELITRLTENLEKITNNYEIILVNDGSRDKSWQVISELSNKYQQVRGINLMRNYGQHNAILCGIRAAKNEIIVTVDDDLQHPPEEIPKLLAKLLEGYDVVYGKPAEEKHGILRDLLSIVTKRSLSFATGIENIRDISAFRAFRTNLRLAFENYQSSNLLLDVLLSWGTTRFTSIEVKHEERHSGKSNYTFRRLLNQTMLILTGFSTLPLRLASMIGFAFAIFGIVILGYAVIHYFLSDTLPGFTFLASLISIFSGAQFLALGIIGEYLARMFNRSMEKPTYIISSTCENSKEN